MWSQLAYPRTFAAWGKESVMVNPRIVRGADRISVGSRCVIYSEAWLQCEYADSSITIGDNCYIGHRLHIHAGSPIAVGDNCWITDDVYIGSLDHDHGIPTATHETGPVRIGNGVLLGLRSVILGGVTIGDGAVVGAHAVVNRDVPAGAVVAGVPARIVKP